MIGDEIKFPRSKNRGIYCSTNRIPLRMQVVMPLNNAFGGLFVVNICVKKYVVYNKYFRIVSILIISVFYLIMKSRKEKKNKDKQLL